MLILLLCWLSIDSSAHMSDSTLVVFWNVENFFDYHSESKPQYWTAKRFYAKANDISKVIFRIAARFGRYPDIIALAEVENRFVLNELCRETLLRKLGYKIAHFDSPDHRGIDCALLYRNLELSECEAKHIYSSGTREILATRDILYAKFSLGLSVLVNHHPSKLGSGSGSDSRRLDAMGRMTSLVDSLGAKDVLCVGDFNDELWGHIEDVGTIKYNGTWEKIDGYFYYGSDSVSESIFDDELLLVKDKNFGGLKPRRTFSGPRYVGGISDHLPIVLVLSHHERTQ